MKKLLTCLLLLLPSWTFADSLSNMIAMVRAVADRYESELPNLNREVSLRYRAPGYWGVRDAKYDHVDRTLSVSEIFHLIDQWTVERCKSASQHRGTNGFGARAIFVRVKCDRVVLHDSWITDEPVVIPMTPTEFRALKTDEPLLEIKFRLMTNSDGLFVKSFTNTEHATLARPREKEIDGFHVYGQIREISVFWPDGHKKMIHLVRD
jgi:hypothetical protein